MRFVYERVVTRVDVEKISKYGPSKERERERERDLEKESTKTIERH